MSEAEARRWIADRFGVSRETAVVAFGELLLEEARHQNLIAASTFETLWTRHLLDSAQLVPLAEGAGAGAWLDIGSGPGLPGLVVALLTDRPIVLVEPRAKRVDFLRRASEALGLTARVTLVQGKIEGWSAPAPAAVISARAVAALPALLAAARHCASKDTVWLLPKGRNAQSEVEAARAKWQGRFHVEPSLTEMESGIVVARGVQPR